MLKLTGVTLALFILAAPLAAESQPAGKVYQVGFLHPGQPGVDPTSAFDVLRQGLRELGWIEGRNMLFEPRHAHDQAMP